jgi:hypothetical protein
MIKPFLLAVTVASALSFVPVRTRAQSSTAPAQSTAGSQAGIDQDIDLLRKDIRSKKKQLIAANLQLTDAEATKFWPVYDQYTAELVKINDAKYALIKQFAETWGSMTNEQALDLTNRALDVDQKVAALRVRYVPLFSQTLPGVKVATFYQIERRVQSIIDLQLSSKLPLVQSQE